MRRQMQKAEGGMMKRREPVNPLYLAAFTLLFISPFVMWLVLWINSLLSLPVKLVIIWVVAGLWLAYEWKRMFNNGDPS